MLFSFLGFVFFIVLIIIFFGLTVISRVLGVLFGFGRRNSSARSASSNNTSDSAYNNKKRNADSTPKRKKLFDDDEGEYVDFEEVKSNDNE